MNAEVDTALLEQGSPEWLQARCGLPTASEFSCVLAKGEGKTRTKYLRRLLTELLTGKPCETFRNAHTDRGQEQEPYARMAYAARTGAMVEQVGLIKHPSIRAGCSPDGLIGEDGGAEIKSVIPTVQLDTILSGSYPSEHKAQIQGSLWVTGRAYWDFCSFSPDMPEHLRVYVYRVKRDDEYIKTLEAEVVKFLAEMDVLYAQLMERKR